jgi:hypothetical protein
MVVFNQSKRWIWAGGRYHLRQIDRRFPALKRQLLALLQHLADNSMLQPGVLTVRRIFLRPMI